MPLLEPVLEWSSLAGGRRFAPVEFTLTDERVDAYLAATGEAHPLYAREGGGFAPFLMTTLVSLSKQAIGGRWPSGTVQLAQRIRCERALRRGERLRLMCEVVQHEVRNGRGYYELLTTIEDERGSRVGEYSARSLWGVPLPAGDSAPAAPSAPAARTAKTANPHGDVVTLGPLEQTYHMADLRAFGEVAGARDPIHLDPEFARSTRYGRNIAQGRLVMTLFSRLLLQAHGRDWLERGAFDLRFSGPVFVGEPVRATAVATSAPGTTQAQYTLLCHDTAGRAVIEGHGGLG